MEMVARVRLVVDVPFTYDVALPDETGHEPTRISAAKYAEEFAETITTSEGTVVERLIEEVRESDETTP